MPSLGAERVADPTLAPASGRGSRRLPLRGRATRCRPVAYGWKTTFTMPSLLSRKSR
jgi:hypothetical protein